MQWEKLFCCCFLLHHPVWYCTAVENSLILCPTFLLLVPSASSLLLFPSLTVWGSADGTGKGGKNLLGNPQDQQIWGFEKAALFYSLSSSLA